MDIKTVASKLKMLNNQIEVVNDKVLIAKSSDGYRMYSLGNGSLTRVSKLYQSISVNSEIGLAIVSVKAADKDKNQLFGIIDFNTDEKLFPMYKSVKIVENKLILAENTFPLLVMDLDFNILIPPLYKKVHLMWKYQSTFIIECSGKNNVRTTYKIEDDLTIKKITTDYVVALLDGGKLLVYVDDHYYNKWQIIDIKTFKTIPVDKCEKIDDDTMRIVIAGKSVNYKILEGLKL